jgi:hypothetical protein
MLRAKKLINRHKILLAENIFSENKPDTPVCIFGRSERLLKFFNKIKMVVYFIDLKR